MQTPKQPSQAEAGLSSRIQQGYSRPQPRPEQPASPDAQRQQEQAIRQVQQ